MNYSFNDFSYWDDTLGNAKSDRAADAGASFNINKTGFVPASQSRTDIYNQGVAQKVISNLPSIPKTDALLTKALAFKARKPAIQSQADYETNNQDRWAIVDIKNKLKKDINKAGYRDAITRLEGREKHINDSMLIWDAKKITRRKPVIASQEDYIINDQDRRAMAVMIERLKPFASDTLVNNERERLKQDELAVNNAMIAFDKKRKQAQALPQAQPQAQPADMQQYDNLPVIEITKGIPQAQAPQAPQAPQANNKLWLTLGAAFAAYMALK